MVKNRRKMVKIDAKWLKIDAKWSKSTQNGQNRRKMVKIENSARAHFFYKSDFILNIDCFVLF